jgi:hypothetical protein
MRTMFMDCRLLLVVGIAVNQAPSTILGRWVGESRCIGPQTSCHDEHVIYRIDSTGARKAVVHGSRVAGPDTVDMGDLSCDRAQLSVACTIPTGTWRFRITGGHLEGSLTRSDRTLLRQVVARRPGRD